MTHKEEKEAHEMAEISHVLLSSPNANSTLGRLFRLRKALGHRVSLASICKRAKIPSTGYLSDVFQGRKALHEKYREGVAKALGLNLIQIRFLMAQFEVEKNPNKENQEQLLLSQKILTVQYSPFPEAGTQNAFLQVLLLSSFSLFLGKPTMEQLESVAGRKTKEMLDHFMATGLISLTNGHYQLQNPQLIFGEGGQGISHIEFLRQMIALSLDNITTLYKERDLAYVTSTAITIRKKDITQIIQIVREGLLRLQLETDCNEGDELLFFNAQVYPMSLFKVEGRG